MKKVVKFGGSSLASAEQFKKVGNIIHADSSRRYVVPSAPGKRFSADIKVTDMLYDCYGAAEREEDFTEKLAAIKARYQEIIDGLGLKFSLDADFEVIQKNFAAKSGSDYAASRGEFLNGKVMAAYLGYEFVDAAEVVRFEKDGTFNAEVTNEILSARLAELEHAVIPGFYGATEDGTVVTFSRGGSDITGSLVALAVQADLYENWTDVSGFLIADPRIVKNSKSIETITFLHGSQRTPRGCDLPCKKSWYSDQHQEYKCTTGQGNSDRRSNLLSAEVYDHRYCRNRRFRCYYG